MVSVVVIVCVIVCVIICVVSCCVDFTKIKSMSPIYYIMYGRTMRTVQQSIALFASFLLVLPLLLIDIYDFVCVYDETIIMDWYIAQ